MAVALDWGLIVPVIKQADTLSLVGLGTRDTGSGWIVPAAKQLKPDEVAGGTFTITNFGLYGGLTADTDHQPAAAGDSWRRRNHTSGRG
jgi:2-oxoglutarate dehydrogenase E2 component (dihydrolipoamide succinyltransferase)